MKAITREEKIISGENLTPITRKEMFLAKASGQSIQTPTPITREEIFLSKITGGGTGGGGSGAIGVLICDNEIAYTGAAIKKLICPNAIEINANGFSTIQTLESVDLPNVKAIGEYAFTYCRSLTSVDLPKITSVAAFAFSNCTSLGTIILRNAEIMCSFNLTAILDTQIATEEGMPTGEGFIYVPASLYEDYVAQFKVQVTELVGDEAVAEQMSRAILRKIEDYPEICGA